MVENIKILFELTKFRITSFVTITAIFGYICFSVELSYHLINAVAGLLLLACGSAALNQVQEYRTDALMKRTKNRPIPSGRIGIKSAVMIAFSLVLLGSVILSLNGILPLILGLVNLVWYNLIYTPLKKVSQLAIIPGALVGAIPPSIGWTSAGGSLTDPQILIIAFFFFIWQIPHFWLLLISFGQEYEQAGLPSLTSTFNAKQLTRITFIWIVATIVSSLLIPLFGILKNQFIYLGLLAAGIWLTINAAKLLKDSTQNLDVKFAFKGINLFALMVILIISLDQVLILL